MTLKVVILISGGGSNMVALIEAMRQKGFAEPALVVSNVPGAGGLERARALGVPTAVVDHRGFAGDRGAFEETLIGEIAPYEPAMVCLAGFMRVLSPYFVTHFDGRLLNIHPSLLPKYPGLDTHARALSAGDAEAGCTVHLVTEMLDAGPILGQARVEIAGDDTPERLGARVLEAEHRLYPIVLEHALSGREGRINVPINFALSHKSP